MTQTLLAFDYGTHRIGVAAGQNNTGSAQGVATIPTTSAGVQWDKIDALINEWQPDTLVIGLALSDAGEETTLSRLARQFGKQLQTRFGRNVRYIDETLTSDAADTLIRESQPAGKRITRRRQKVRDQIAAELILQTYLHEQSDT